MMKKATLSLEELMAKFEFFFRMMDQIVPPATSRTERRDRGAGGSQIDSSIQNNAATAEAGPRWIICGRATDLAENVKKFKTIWG